MGKEVDISADMRTQVMQFLLNNFKGGKMIHGSINKAAVLFNLSRDSISRIWRAAKQQKQRGEVIQVAKDRKGRIRKKKHTCDFQVIEAIDYHKRGTITALSDALGPLISRATVGRWAKLLRHHSNAIKPLLTAPNMLWRLGFSLRALHFDFARNTPTFKAMENTIHIDKKWFYLTKKSCRYYLTPMEADPLRVTQSKNFIPKVMFMCAISRPVFAEDGSVKFDGKIGIWPFIEEKTAQRNSIKRPRGTVELKPIQSITRQVVKDCFLDEILPAIKLKWPQCLSKHIEIQQDNCRSHISNQDADFQAAANADGFNMKIVQQPANSPNCNANDLGLFTAIQSLQQRLKCKDPDELIELIAAVQTSFQQMEAQTMNKVFISLQCVLVEIMKVRGMNNFKLPHMSKDSLLRQGLLPQNLDVPEHLVRECIDHLLAEEKTEGLDILMEELGINIPQAAGEAFDLNM